MDVSEEMNRLLGIGPEHELSTDIKKKLRVGTVKELKEINDLFDGLLRIKYLVTIEKDEPEKYEEQVNRWVEILNLITIEGFTREEFDDSLPEQMASAVTRFLFE